jgi:hypothetical protein
MRLRGYFDMRKRGYIDANMQLVMIWRFHKWLGIPPNVSSSSPCTKTVGIYPKAFSDQEAAICRRSWLRFALLVFLRCAPGKIHENQSC